MTDSETMYQAYIEAVYFTDTGDSEQPSNDAILTDLFTCQARNACSNFVEAVRREIDIHPNKVNWAQAGHDLWLTRNGHGTGFWDRDNDTYGETSYGEPIKNIFSAMALCMGEHESEWRE